jgi:hypothetical protein
MTNDRAVSLFRYPLHANDMWVEMYGPEKGNIEGSFVWCGDETYGLEAVSSWDIEKFDRKLRGVPTSVARVGGRLLMRPAPDRDMTLCIGFDND